MKTTNLKSNDILKLKSTKCFVIRGCGRSTGARSHSHCKSRDRSHDFTPFLGKNLSVKLRKGNHVGTRLLLPVWPRPLHQILPRLLITRPQPVKQIIRKDLNLGRDKRNQKEEEEESKQINNLYIYCTCLSMQILIMSDALFCSKSRFFCCIIIIIFVSFFKDFLWIELALVQLYLR